MPVARRRRVDATIAQLRALLPPDWSVGAVGQEGDVTLLRITDAAGTESALPLLTTTGSSHGKSAGCGSLPRVGARLGRLAERAFARSAARASASYIDRSGNVEIRLGRPGLYIRTEGAARDPIQAIKGTIPSRATAWALLRTLVEVRPPYTAGDLAAASASMTGTSRECCRYSPRSSSSNALPRGPVTSAEWEPLLRKITATYSLLDANTTSTWIAAAGPDRLVNDLSGLRLGAGRSPVRSSPRRSHRSLHPRWRSSTPTTPNGSPRQRACCRRRRGDVVLAQPYDPIVFERAGDQRREVGVDRPGRDRLSTGPGRMPAEGEALLAWMRRNEPRWRATGLTA